jgi:bacillithiol system protein YtxJ
MFNWLRRKEEACRAGEMPAVCAATDLDALLQSDLVVLFKHSTACPVSWAAHAQVNRFRLSHPDIPVHLVDVIRERPTSKQIAELTDVWHESPQIIVVRRGKAVASASHGEITQDRLKTLVSQAPVAK